MTTPNLTHLKSSRFRLLCWTGLSALGLLNACRLCLLIQNWSLVSHTWFDLTRAFVFGACFDLVVLGILGAPVAAWTAFREAKPAEPSGWRGALGSFIAWFAFIYLLVADLFFFEEFNAHFNYVAVDYIFVNGQEVVNNIRESYPVLPISILIGLGALGLTLRLRQISRRFPSLEPPRRPLWLVGWVLVTTTLFVAMPLKRINSFNSRVLGEISTNGFYTLGYALWTNNLAYDNYYVTVPREDGVARVRRRVLQTGQKFLPGKSPVLRRVEGITPPHRMNVVIILEESFGSEFVDLLYPHPQPITPEFSALAKQGLFFNHIYATGNRTVRGLEGVLASFPPIPGASIVKRKPERSVPTIATVLKAAGYKTSFIYGGHGLFDNMRSFTKRNGFDTFIEQKDYTSSVFTTAWGVSDEDIFRKANETFDGIKDGPFLSVILTVSNHRPYMYPPGRIDLDPMEKKRENAVKYADWAIGQYFKEARQRPYFKNTLFVLLGDHGARVYGADFIPLRSYEIPLLFYAPAALQPRVAEVVGGSMDVAPTILGILGLTYDSPFFGRDLRRVPEGKGYALMQHDRDVALLDNNLLAILSTPKSTALFDFNPVTKTSTPHPPRRLTDQSLIEDTAAFYQTAYDVFEQATP